jgi:macrophage erythroblast attacher
MADFSSIKLNPDSHLLLDQSLLRLPYELSRNNFKSAQRSIEQSQAKIDELIKAGSRTANDADTSKTMASIDQAVQRLQTLKRKLSSLNESQNLLVLQSEARIDYLEQLYEIPTLADVKYDQWSRTRLDRLLVDYMLRNGYFNSARELATDKDIEALVDVDEFEAVAKIENSIRKERRVDLAMAWCGENKLNLKKINVCLESQHDGQKVSNYKQSDFEYSLRLQQFVEMVRTGQPEKLIEATLHAKKYLSENTLDSQNAAGLIAYFNDWDNPALTQPYRVS